MPQADDTMKCELKPLRRADYPVTFTDAQCARAARRRSRAASATTPSRGVDRTPTVPWLSYADGPGGKPLGDPDTSTSLRLPVAPLADRHRAASAGSGSASRAARLARRVPGRGHRDAALVALVREAQQRDGAGRVLVEGQGRAGRHDRPQVRNSRPASGNAREHPGLRRLLGPRRAIGVRRGKVRFVAVTSPGVVKNRKLLRRYLKLAGLRR